MPPEQTPIPPQNFDFIMNSTQPKARRFGNGGNKTHRIMMVVISGIVLVILAFVFLSFVQAANKRGGAELVDLAAYQTELARIMTIGVTDAQSLEVKSVAQTGSFTLISDLGRTKKMIRSLNVKAKDSDLVRYKTPEIDKQLDDAKTANNFDLVYSELIDEKLENYKTKLASVFAAQSNQAVQQTLRSFKAHAELLPFSYSAPVTKL